MSDQGTKQCFVVKVNDSNLRFGISMDINKSYIHKLVQSSFCTWQKKGTRDGDGSLRFPLQPDRRDWEETDSRAVCKGQRPLMLPLIIFLSLVNLLTSENSKNHWNHWVSPQFMMFWYMSWYMLTVWMWQSCLSAPQEAPLSPPSSPSSPSSPWARHRWKGIGVFLKFLVWPPGL